MTWQPWLSSIGVQATNNTNAVTALVKNTLGNPFLPPVFLILTVALYIVFWISYSESPSRAKVLGIAAIIMILSFFEAYAGLLPDAVISIIIFLISWVIVMLFRGRQG